MMHFGKEIAPLTRMDIIVADAVEGLAQHGMFITTLVQALVYADPDNTENLRKGFPEVVQSFERWKSGQTGMLRDQHARKNDFLFLVK